MLAYYFLLKKKKRICILAGKIPLNNNLKKKNSINLTSYNVDFARSEKQTKKKRC